MKIYIIKNYYNSTNTKKYLGDIAFQMMSGGGGEGFLGDNIA